MRIRIDLVGPPKYGIKKWKLDFLNGLGIKFIVPELTFLHFKTKFSNSHFDLDLNN